MSLRTPPPVSPGQCIVVISFNDLTAGPYSMLRGSQVVLQVGVVERVFCTSPGSTAGLINLEIGVNSL
jgi:hypothetical protein